MPFTMMLLTDANGNQLSHSGQYLQEFDFEAADGHGKGFFTADRSRAMRFETLDEALDFRERTPVCRPLRDDGQPNRPLTATTWQIETYHQ